MFNRRVLIIRIILKVFYYRIKFVNDAKNKDCSLKIYV